MIHYMCFYCWMFRDYGDISGVSKSVQTSLTRPQQPTVNCAFEVMVIPENYPFRGHKSLKGNLFFLVSTEEDVSFCPNPLPALLFAIPTPPLPNTTIIATLPHTPPLASSLFTFSHLLPGFISSDWSSCQSLRHRHELHLLLEARKKRKRPERKSQDNRNKHITTRA